MATSFHPFTRLPITLQSDILASALPQKPVLISAFWNHSSPTSRECSLFLPQNSSYRTLQNIAALNDPLSPLVPIYLTQTVSSSQSQESPLPAPKTETIFLRPSIDILYLPYRFLQQSVSTCRLNIPDFLSREANQKIRRLAISRTDFFQIFYAELHPTVFPESPLRQVVFGLRNLEVLYVIGGDERARLSLPWHLQPRTKREEQGDRISNVVVGKWTGEEDVELVGLGEGTFQMHGGRFAGIRGEVERHQPLGTRKSVEKMWRSLVEIIVKKKEMGEWKVRRVVGCEVRCIGE
jgi:hypothetical protein